ncbi:hypothetical protein Sste5344_003800, partial [Sporothrix stenoceras]
MASPIAEGLLDNNAENIAIYVKNFYNRSSGFIDLLKADGVYGYYMDHILAPGAMMTMLNDYRA